MWGASKVHGDDPVPEDDSIDGVARTKLVGRFIWVLSVFLHSFCHLTTRWQSCHSPSFLAIKIGQKKEGVSDYVKAGMEKRENDLKAAQDEVPFWRQFMLWTILATFFVSEFLLLSCIQLKQCFLGDRCLNYFTLCIKRKSERRNCVKNRSQNGKMTKTRLNRFTVSFKIFPFRDFCYSSATFNLPSLSLKLLLTRGDPQETWTEIECLGFWPWEQEEKHPHGTFSKSFLDFFWTWRFIAVLYASVALGIRSHNNVGRFEFPRGTSKLVRGRGGGLAFQRPCFNSGSSSLHAHTHFFSPECNSLYDPLQIGMSQLINANGIKKSHRKANPLAHLPATPLLWQPPLSLVHPPKIGHYCCASWQKCEMNWGMGGRWIALNSTSFTSPSTSPNKGKPGIPAERKYIAEYIFANLQEAFTEFEKTEMGK